MENNRNGSESYTAEDIKVLKGLELEVGKGEFVSIIGSFSWAGKEVEQITGMLGNLKVEVIEPVISKGLPREKDFEALNTLAERIAQKHREIGILK